MLTDNGGHCVGKVMNIMQKMQNKMSDCVYAQGPAHCPQLCAPPIVAHRMCALTNNNAAH